MARRPNNRKDRIDWIKKKLGPDFASLLLYFTDRQLKQEFEKLYRIYKDRSDYVRPEVSLPVCLVCHTEADITWTCQCGDNAGFYDERDPLYQEYIKNLANVTQ